MVRQYPYTLYALQLSGGGFDGDGNPLPSTSSFVAVCQCRDEANSGGRQINLIDGSAHVFDSLIQTPRGTAPLTVGTSVEVRDGSTVRVKGTVKRSQKDQLHTRLWV
jgi:hypothetical protein